MRDFNAFTVFILKNDFSDEQIENIKELLSLNNKQLIKESFKFLNYNIGNIENNTFYNEIILNTVNLICNICDKEEFNETEVITNRNRIKKSRESILAYSNKFNNSILQEAANKLDEIILDKNLNIEDLSKLLKKLIDRKEDINIIKKFLNTNKGVILLEKNDLFDYCFNLSMDALVKNNSNIYYYISLLKIFYSSKIDKKKYIELLNSKSDEKNSFANEIYNIINGVKRSLKPEEIISKYGIITDLKSENITLSNKSKLNEKIFTIDSSKTKLRDDAISIKKDGNKYIIGIHIADPSKSIEYNGILYNQALNNFKCIYLPNGGIRMFPNKIENLLSLDKNKNRNVISLYAVLNDSGDLIDYFIKQNEIKVTHNFSHSQCDNYIDYSSDIELSYIFNNMYYVACSLENKNKTKNEYWNKKNSDKDITSYQHKSDKIIGEFMILYNSLLATLAFKENIPFVYRTQDKSYFDDLIKELDIKKDDSMDKLIKNIYLVSKYSITPSYHNGLKLPIYSHSADPLRRFPDLYNEYLLHYYYFKDNLINFNDNNFEEMVNYFNQRNTELSLMRSEYSRALKLQKKN